VNKNVLLAVTSATRKWEYASFADDHTSELASEDSRSAKRRSAPSQAESLARSAVCTSTSTTTTPASAAGGSHFSPLRVGNPSASGGDGGSDTSNLSRSDLLDLQNGGDGEHEGAIEKDLLHSSRQLISPSERRPGDQNFSPYLEMGEDNSDASDGEVGGSHEDNPVRLMTCQ
jgi:hypothetical protein